MHVCKAHPSGVSIALRHVLVGCCLALAMLPALAQAPDPDAGLKQQVNAFVDEWHADAAHARWAYFDKIATDGVYIGTDESELWRRDAFKAWASRFFVRGKAWSFKAIRRNVYLSPDKKFIWFDELPDTPMGVCQASGVISTSATGFAIEHYQLSMAVPNPVADKVSATIKAFEAAPAAK